MTALALGLIAPPQRLYKHLGGQPLTSRRPPEELSVDWEAMFPAPRDGAVEAVIGALHGELIPAMLC